MLKTKFIRILKSLNGEELLHFEQFVATSYFNTNKSIIKLLEFILPFAPDYDDKKMTDEQAHLFIFPRATFISKKRVVTKLSSKALTLLSEFIAMERYKKSDFAPQYDLLLHYRDRKLVDDFHTLAKKIKQSNSKKDVTTEIYYEDFLVEKELNRVISRTVDTGIGDVNFQNAADALDRYFIYSKLVYVCQQLNRSQVVNSAEAPKYFLQILKSIEDTPFIDDPQIKVWYKAYILLSIEDIDKKINIYYELKELLFQKNSMLSNDQIRLLFTYLENTASRYMSFQNPKVYYNELYDLYDFQNQHKILLETKTSVPILIKNFVTVLLNLNKHDEANEFLDSNKKTILPLFKNHFDICKAMIAFDMGKPEDALDILNEVNLKNIYLKINEKRLRIKIYYQLEYYDLLMDYINSFRVYLSNNKDTINEYHLMSNKSFINFVSKISKKNIKDNHLILEEIHSTGRLSEKKWLISIL
jgi:hypothetical protein